jgi:DNA-binding NarL/FixJ family response regulator
MRAGLAADSRLALLIGAVPATKMLVSELMTASKAQVIAVDADLFEQGTLAPANPGDVEGHAADVLLLFDKIAPQAVELCLSSHAHGCLEFDASAETFAHAVDAMAHGGELWFPRWMMEPFYEMALATTTQGHAPDTSDLTEREAEALSLAQLGLTNKEIGARLRISPHTAKKHLHNALIKHGIRRRRQLYR